MKDIDGNRVDIGDSVDIISINEASLEYLEPEYAEEIRAAVGQILKVDDIDEHDRVWVNLVSESDDESRCGQTLFLRSIQIRKSDG